MDNEEQLKLLHTIIGQQKAHIQAQEARLAEKDAAITDLRKLVDELISLKVNLEETLRELRRQFFGASSEKTVQKSRIKLLRKPPSKSLPRKW